jgi:hypothetical protein
MPSIEIFCVGLTASEPLPETSFAVICDRSRQSHRGPTPRFQADFDRLEGVLYHLGNPELAADPDGPFFAYDILSDASRGADPSSFLELAPAHVVSARRLLDCLFRSSPAKRLIFTSDWQFGPPWTRRFELLSLDEFWQLHDSRQLLLNSAYFIEASPAPVAANDREPSP